jgi:hypothetical protein
MSGQYDTIPVSAAMRALVQMDAGERDEVSDCLVHELERPPDNAEIEVNFRGRAYTAKILSCGYVVIFRAADERELRRAAVNEGRSASDNGYVIFDLLPPEAGFVSGGRIFQLDS